MDISLLANDSKEYDFQAKQYLTSVSANITSIRELRQKTHDGSTLHVEIDCASAGISYKTAQNLAIYPENSSDVVIKAANLLNLNLNDVFEVTQNSELASKGKFKHPIPSPISVKTYLTKFCDLQSALRYSFKLIQNNFLIERSNLKISLHSALMKTTRTNYYSWLLMKANLNMTFKSNQE